MVATRVGEMVWVSACDGVCKGVMRGVGCVSVLSVPVVVQIDVIGLPFLDIVHADDRDNLSKIQNVTSAEDLQEKAREFFPCVLRMKTNVSPTVRSQAKVQYKVVCCVHVVAWEEAIVLSWG